MFENLSGIAFTQICKLVGLGSHTKDELASLRLKLAKFFSPNGTIHPGFDQFFK